MEIRNIEPKIRFLKDMKEVVYDSDFAKKNPDIELYYMYRNLFENEQDNKIMEEKNLRYDITVLNPVMIGKEFNKTAGHDHPLVPGTNITYPEIYEVLEGEVIFLIQDSKEDEIKNVFAIKSKKGDKIIMPPNYEHIMINASNKKVKTANWICNVFMQNIYEPFKKSQGFSYYALKSDSGEIEWIKNENYKNIPELKFIEPNQRLEQFRINKNEEIYNLIKDLSKLDFLKNPQNYEWGK